MAKDKRVFTGGMDKDSDPRLIKQGDYRHAENIRNIASSDGTSGSVENIESTVKVPYSFKGEDVDKIIVVDEGKASVLPQRSVFYSQTITFEFMSYVEEWSGKERNSFTMYSYTPERELEQIGHRWSANGSLRWSEHSFKPTAEHIFDLFNEESGTISKNIPIINLNTGEWETAHSKVNIPVRSFVLGGGRKISIEIIADKKGVPFLLDFSSPGSDRYWTQSIEDYPPYGRINLTGGPNSVIYSPLVLSSQSSFYSEDTNTQVLDEFVDVDGNSFDNDVPTPIEGDTITEYTLSFEGEEPTSPQDANEIQIFSYTENSLGDFEVAPFFSFGDGLYNSGQTYEFDANQSSLSNSLHDAFEKFEGKVLHKGETAIDGSLDATKGQISLGFSKGESLKGNNFSEVQDSANASASDFGLFKGFYNSDSLGGYASQPSIEILNGDITLTESSLANNNSWKFPLKLSKNNAYLVQADISDFNASSAVLDVKIPSSSKSANSKDLKASDSGLSIDGVNNNFEWIIPASDLETNSRSLEIDFISGAIEEDESVTIKNLRVSKLKKSSFKLDVSLRSLTDFNLCFGSSEEQVLASLREGADLSKQEEFVDGSIFAKLSLERKQGKDLGYVSDQLIEAQEKIEELNNVIAALNTDLKNLKTSYNETLKDINDILPLDGNVTLTLFNELENKSSTLATTITDVNTKVDDLVSKVTVFQTPEQLAKIAELEQSIVDLQADIDALNLASQTAAAQALIDIQAARDEGIASVTPEDGVTQADVDAVQALLDAAKLSLAAALADVETYNDGVTQADVDAVQALLDQAGIDLADLNEQVSDLTDSEAAVTAQLNTKQQEVLDIQASLDEANENLATALANQEDGITQTDVDNAVNPIKTLLIQARDEINAVDPNDGLADSVVDSFQDLISTALATLTTKKEELTGVFDSTQTSSDIADINASITALQTEIVRLQGVETNQITKEDVTTAVTNLKDILVNASTVDLASLTSTDAATQALLDAISNQVTEASTIITDAITKIDQQKQNAVNDAVSGLYTFVQLNQKYTEGFTAGAASVDITSDNQGVIDTAVAEANRIAAETLALEKDTSFAAGVASVTEEDGINQSHVDAAYQSGFDAGVAFVDITTDNQASFDAGVASVDITTDNQASFDAGVAAVKNNPSAYSLYTQAQYEANFTSGVNSVDIKIDNEGVASAAFAQGVTDTQNLFNNDLTQLTLEQAQDAGLAWAKGIRDGFFGAGVASVDITSDNEAVRSAAYAEGAASVTPEDGITSEDVAEVQAKLDSLNSLIGALPDSYTDSASITTVVNNIQTTLNTVVDTKSSLITSLVNAFNAGVASVDITTDNQGFIDTAVDEINTALTNAKADLKILESDLTVITQDTQDALKSLLDEANQKITNAQNATELVQDDLDAIEASLLAADLLLDATVVKTDSETGETINNTQASLDAVIVELADLKNKLFGFDAEKYANVQAQVNAAVTAATDTMYASVAAAVETVAAIQQKTTGITITNINTAIDVVLGTIDSVDGITQAEKDSAHAAAAASITSDDGITEAEVATALEAAVTDYSGAETTFTSAQIKDAVRQITLKITPEDGVTQVDVDAVQASLETAISTLRNALGLSADAEADAAANITALTTKITQLNIAQAELAALNASATGVDTDFPTAANLILNYSSLKADKENLEAKIADMITLLESATGTFEEGQGGNTLVPQNIQETIEELKGAQDKLNQIVTNTDSTLNTVVSVVSGLKTTSDNLSNAHDAVKALVNSFRAGEDAEGQSLEGILTDSYAAIGRLPNPAQLQAGSQGNLLFSLLFELEGVYNSLYDSYTNLNSTYTELVNDPNTAIKQSDVDAVQTLLNEAIDAKKLANDSLTLLYGKEVDNYIGNGSFNDNLTTDWNNLYDSTNAATNFWVVENEMLKRSPYLEEGRIGSVNYTGSGGSNAKKIQDGTYIFSINLKTLGLGAEYDNDSIYVSVLDTLDNFYFEDFNVNGLGFHTNTFTVENLTEDAYFKVGISFNGDVQKDFNLGIDNIKIVKIPDVEYSQETLEAFIYKINIEQSIIDYQHLIVAMDEQHFKDLQNKEQEGYNRGYGVGYDEGADSVTPEDGVSQADVDAAVAAVDITSDNQGVYDSAYALGVASVDITSDNIVYLKPHLQRIALGLEGHPTPQTVILENVNTAQYNWEEIKELNHSDLKTYIFNKIDALIELSQFGGLDEATKQLIQSLDIDTQQYINNLNADNITLTNQVNNLNTELSSFVSFFSQSLLSIRNQNDTYIKDFTDNLSFASDYAGATGVFVDGSFLIDNAKFPSGNFFAGTTTFVDIQSLGNLWSVGDTIYNNENVVLGVIDSIGSPDSNGVYRVTFTSSIAINVKPFTALYNKRLDQLVTDGNNIESVLGVGDVVHISSDSSGVLTLGEVKNIENGPDYHETNNPNEKLITFVENIDTNIPDNTEILFNTLLDSLRDEFEINASSIQEFISSILNEVSGLSNITEESSSLKQTYRFTLFGTPGRKSMPKLNDIGRLSILMRNPEIPGYESFGDQGGRSIRILDIDSNYGSINVNPSNTVLAKYKEFNQRGDIGSGDEDSNFVYHIIETPGDSLGTILKLKILYNEQDISSSPTEGMDISNLDITDIEGNDVSEGFCLIVSVLKGSFANKWEFALSSDTETNILIDSKTQWNVIEEQVTEEQFTTTVASTLTVDKDSDLSTITSESDSNWVINEYTTGQGWAWNSNGYYEGVNGGVVSPEDGGGFNQANSLSLPLPDLKPNTTYEIKFIKETIFDAETSDSVYDDWALPSLINLQDIADWQSSLGGSYPSNYTPLVGTYWSIEGADAADSVGYYGDQKVGVFSSDGTVDITTVSHKFNYNKVRPVAVIPLGNTPSYAQVVGSEYAGGIVYEVTSYGVHIVALNDVENDFTETASVPFASHTTNFAISNNSFDHKFQDGTNFYGPVDSPNRFQVRFSIEINDDLEINYGRSSYFTINIAFNYKYVVGADSDDVTSIRRFMGYLNNFTLDVSHIQTVDELKNLVVNKLNEGGDNYSAVFGLGPEGSDGFVTKDGISIFGTTNFSHSTQGTVTPSAPHKVYAVKTESGIDIVLVSNYITPDSSSDVTSEVKTIRDNSTIRFLSYPRSTTFGFDGVTKSSSGKDAYIPYLDLSSHQFAVARYYDVVSGSLLRDDSHAHSQNVEDLDGVNIDGSDRDNVYSNHSSLSDYFSDKDLLWSVPALLACEKYQSSAALFDENKIYDLKVSLNNGPGSTATPLEKLASQNNLSPGFRGTTEYLRLSQYVREINLITPVSAQESFYEQDFFQNPKLQLSIPSLGGGQGTIEIRTGPQYDPTAQSAGAIIIKPSGDGFKGRFYGVQVNETETTPNIIVKDSYSLSILGEKIISAETHNVINQSPVYGTALSNAYNSNKTLIRNNNTGNVDVTPLIEGGYVCVGAYEDKPKNKIYYFVSEEGKDKKRDSILEYDLMNDKITTVYQDDVGSSSGDSNVILNFSESHLITGINKVDDILYFTDNLNRPRKINVELAKKNEENISNPPYVFQDTFFNTFESTVFIGGNNDHPLKAGDYVYTQYDSTTDKNSCFNGYAEVLGVAPKLNQGVTIAINKGDTSATLSSTDHGLSSSNVGEFLAIVDGTLPHYYKIVSVSGATIGLENPYNESNKTEAKPLNIDGLNVSGIITDCPFGNSVSSSQGKILYANPKDAYSPLITFGEYESKMKYFDVIKHQPTHRPSIEMRKDSSVATNNIIDNVFQFKYRYNHFDEENTAYSSISDVAIDGSYAINAPVNASDFDLVKNMIEVYYDDAISDVEFIEIVARKGNDGKFFLIESVPNNFINYLKSVKNSLILDSEDEYVIEKSSIKFYNNGVYPFVDELDSDKLFDSVPIKAKAQTIMSNNRLAYGNIVEGYDNTDLVVKTSFNSEEAPVLETETSDILFDPSIPSGYTENENGYDNKTGGGRPTFNPTVDFNNINLSSDKSQFIELDFNSVFEYKKTGPGTIYRSSNFYGAWRVTGITTAQELADFIVNRIENGDFVGGTGTGEATDNTNKASVSASSNASGKVTIRFEWSQKNSGRMSSIHSTNLRFKSQTVAGKLTSGTVGVGAFKSGAFHNFGIAYFDETNRCSFVNTAPSYANVNVSGGDVKNLNGTRAYNPFYTESGGPKLGQGSSVSLEIYNQAPDWAKYFQIYYTGNNTVDEFVQMTVTRAEHGQSTGDDQMYLSLNSLKGKDYSYNQTNNSQLDYNFVPGDRIRFISCVKDGSRVKFNEYIDLEIAGEDLFQGTDNPIGDNEGYYIRINDPKNDAVKIISDTSDTTGTVDISTQGSRDSVTDSGYNELIVEIYRPKKNTEEDFMVYYEVGDKYPIFNGYHSGDSSQGGEFRFDGVPNIKISETPAVININSGDVYLKPRTMFTSGDDSGTDATTFFPEDYNLNDFHNTNHYSKGRVNVINVNSKARRLDASVYYSEPYSSTGSINGLSSFNLATQPYFDYNKGFGSIQSLQTKDDDLIIFHENKVGRVLVEKDILNTASGDGLVSLSRDIIKNYITVYSGEYGCCLQPESIVKYNDKFYFVDIKRGAVLRLSNDGITAISDYGMRDYFRDIGEMYVEYDPETQDNQVFNIVAGFDPKYNEYIVTLPAVYDKTEGLWDSDVKTWNSKSDRFSVVSPQKIFFAKTVAFNEDIDRWTSFYNFYPEFYSRVNNQFVGFQAGYMFKHNMTDRYYQDLYLNSPVASKSSPNYNVCYDKVLDSMIEFPFNAEPDSVKNYNAISLNSDTKLFTNMKTNIGQTGVGEDNYSGYNNVISTGIGFRKVKGEVISVNGKYLVGNSNSSNGDICKFYEDLHKGDIIKIIGKRKSEDAVSFATYAIVNAISSNTLITLNKEVELNVVSHLEVIDYRTKEGMQYAQIPFVSSMGYESESLGFNGDGSELSFVGVMNSIPFDYAEGSVFASVNIVPRVTYSVNEIAPDKMITGAMYVLSSISNNDSFDINNVSNTSATGYTNTVGEAFICSSRSSSTLSRVVPVTERAFVQDLNTNEVIFIGYPFGFVQESGSNFNKIKVSLSEEGKAFIASNPSGASRYALFLAKDGNIEGERLKGSYMMATLTTKSPSSTSKSDLPKYKFNLYSASVDVDKSELSGQ